jgi:hypothetical protein
MQLSTFKLPLYDILVNNFDEFCLLVTASHSSAIPMELLRANHPASARLEDNQGKG